VCLLVLAFGLVSASAASGDYIRVKVETANVRKQPTTRAEAVWQVYENDPLRVVAKRGAWRKVRDFAGDEGWVYAPLTDERPAVIVTASVANVRSGPGTGHPVAYTADRGVAFLLVGTRGEWLEVEHADGARGWLHRTLVWGPGAAAGGAD
jgi:SH3-like domain-containing protein